jgi:hypothetical protein
MRWRALNIYLITTEGGSTKVQFRKSTNDRAKPRCLFGPNFKWEGATRGARLAGAVLFDPAPGRALVRAYAGHTKSICTRGDATHVAAVPNTPATVVEPPTVATPTGVWPATGLRRRVRCTARLSPFPPPPVEHTPGHQGGATCVCARPAHRSPPALPHVGHLHADCRLAVLDEPDTGRSAISSAPRFATLASKERLEAGPQPSAPQTDQRPAA